MSSDQENPAAGSAARTLRSLAHDLGNLAYRLDFFRLNLKGQIPDEAARSSADALLADTTESLRRVIERLREVQGDV